MRDNDQGNISNTDWEVIRGCESEMYLSDTIKINHLLARIMVDFTRKGERDKLFPTNVADDLDTFIQTGINVFRQDDRSEVKEYFACADRLSALGLKLEACGKLIQETLTRINQVRPGNLELPDFAFDDEEWEVVDMKK